MKTVVIDTNVLICANEQSEEADSKCAAQSARILHESMTKHIVLIDDAQMAVAEYKKYCNHSGQPGVGDRFFQQLFRNIANTNRVRVVDIGKSPDEVSNHVPESLQNFDRSDQKWIALYICGEGDVIYNATDSDYSEAKDALTAEGIVVEELCLNCIRLKPKR